MAVETKQEIYSLLSKYKMPVFTQSYEEVQRIHTGSINLDWALGGGLPRGRAMEIGGLWSYGKTTLSLVMAGEITNNGGRVGFIDAETTLDWKWAEALGVNDENFMLWSRSSDQLATGEETLQFILDLLAKNDEFGLDLIILDSIAVLAPRAQLEGDMDDKPFAARARLLAQFFDNLPGVLAKSNTCLLMLNQGRIDIGSMAKDKTIFPGGFSRKHGNSIMVKLLQPESISFVNGTRESTAHKFRGYTTKNKTSPNGREFGVTVRYDPYVHVDKIADLVDTGKICEVFLDRNGQPHSGNSSWFFNDVSLGSSRATVEDYLQNHTDTCEEIYQEIRNRITSSAAKVEPHDVELEQA